MRLQSGCRGYVIGQLYLCEMKSTRARSPQRLHGALKTARVIIQAMHLVAIIQQSQAGMGTNVASRSSDRDLH